MQTFHSLAMTCVTRTDAGLSALENTVVQSLPFQRHPPKGYLYPSSVA